MANINKSKADMTVSEEFFEKPPNNRSIENSDNPKIIRYVISVKFHSRIIFLYVK